jgi:hypothetical protein
MSRRVLNTQPGIVIGVLLIGAVVACGQTTGGIQGTVVAASGGAAIHGATVIAQRISPAPIVRTQSVKSATDGSFTINSVLPGQYVFCVIENSGNYLSPCEWLDQHPTTVTVAAGAAAGPVTVKVAAASTLQVRLNDPSAVAAAVLPGKKAPPLLLIAVHGTAGSFHPAFVMSRDPLGTTYGVKIPFDTMLQFHLQGPQLAIVDSSQTAVPSSGYKQAFQHSSGKTAAQQTSFTFHVTGTQP